MIDVHIGHLLPEDANVSHFAPVVPFILVHGAGPGVCRLVDGDYGVCQMAGCESRHEGDRRARHPQYKPGTPGKFHQRLFEAFGRMLSPMQ